MDLKKICFVFFCVFLFVLFVVVFCGSVFDEENVIVELEEMVCLQMQCLDFMGGFVCELMIVWYLMGWFFVLGYGLQVIGMNLELSFLFWSSDDEGVIWNVVDVGDSSVGVVGNFDVDLMVGLEGIFYFVLMGFD